ncbi:MAG TPA: ABC transporter permease [Longimicrobiales bacterium]|nr:ABC transporter permease [Longimicrobiales bacterium]
MRGHAGDRTAALAYNAPALLYLAALFAAPMAVVAIYSFIAQAPDAGAAGRLTLDNYVRALDPLYLSVLGHSVALALATTVITLCIAYPCALAMRSLPPRRRAIALALIVIPSWMNLLVKNYAWIVILRREGVLNTLLTRTGVLDAPLTLLFNDGAVLLGLVHTALPFMILPLYAAVDRMDWSLVEAARDLGAGRLATFRAIVLPQTRAGALVGTVLVFIPTLGAFVTPDLLGGTRSLMVANLIENQVLQVRDWPFAAALSMFLIALVLLGVYLLRRATRDTGTALA